MKFHILIFGCQMNYADSARIKAVLTNCGFSYTENIEDADIVIFDTCSVRQKSEDKITGKIKEIKKNQKIWITGCMIQHNLRNQKIQKNKVPEQMERGNFLGAIQTNTPEILGISNEEIEEAKIQSNNSNYVLINHAFNPLFHRLTQKTKNIELFFRIDDTGFLPLILKKLGYTIQYDEEMINEYCKIIPEGQNTSMYQHNKVAYVPISTGCNQFCSYCIVPYARGLEKHFPMEHIIQEVQKHLDKGKEEIVLLGQIVNKHPQFVEVLKKVLQLKGLKWLRYTSPYPNYYTPELLKLHETEEKLCPHIHIPLQSGSTKVLKEMHRGYTAEQAEEFIKNIQSLTRKISITTDIIVGFPNETEENFEDTLNLVQQAKFDMIYIGIYSPRPGTYAAKNIKDNIDRKTKRSRRNKLNTLLKQISQTNNTDEIGTIKEMIVNIQDETGIYGYTENMKQIHIKTSNTYPLGTFLKVKVTKSQAFKLEGERDKTQ